MDRLYCTYNDINLMIRQLWEQIYKSEIVFDVVVGIKNGGLYISKRLSQMLGLPHRVVHINRYNNTNLKKQPFIHNVSFEPNYWGSPLIIDDIINTGGTIKLFKKHFGKEVITAVLFWKKDAVEKPDFYAREKFNDYIFMPWKVQKI